jgi:hypothetical protein
MKEYLYKILSGQLSKDAFSWMKEALKNAASTDGELKTYQAFARIPSVTGKLKINFTPQLLREADQLRSGWNPTQWSIDQAARILLLLSLPDHDPQDYKNRLRKFFEVADMSELETLCLGLPIYPFPEQHIELAKQGLRSNMKSVFEAIALNNPYPADYFDIHAWNQMVLKVLFVESPVYKIHKIDQRSNSNLASMLCDYAHERWAAGRVVNPELWRPVGPFIEDKIFPDIQRVFYNEDQVQQEAAALACSMSNFSAALQLLDSNKELKNKIIHKEINWETVAKRWYENKAIVH